MKTTSNPTPPANRLHDRGASPIEAPALWSETKHVYPIYAALANQFELGAQPCTEQEILAEALDRELFSRVAAWLDQMDLKIQPQQLRQLLQTTLHDVGEPNLRALAHRHLRRPAKTALDRDKIDFLLVQYFALCAPESALKQAIAFTDVARVLASVLDNTPDAAPGWFSPLDDVLAELKGCQSLRDLLESGFMEQGRTVKESAGDSYYDPPALVAFCRFNFLMRRAFIRLIHADLTAIREAVAKLEMLGIRTIDCKRSGLSATEPLAHLLELCQEWKQPFRSDYTEQSVGRNFAQLLAIRADAEEALARTEAGSPAATAPEPAVRGRAPDQPPKPASRAPDRDQAVGPSEQTAPARSEPNAAGHAEQIARRPPRPVLGPTAASTKPPKPEHPAASGAAARPLTQDTPKKPAPPPDLESCLESIWEQLIAAPPARGRSMASVVLHGTKILLSPWEVAAFVSDNDPASEDLRRAVVARAMVGVALDSSKRSGDPSELSAALPPARTEYARLQKRVDQAKTAKDVETAVNLGISAKRLLAFIEEAEGFGS